MEKLTLNKDRESSTSEHERVVEHRYDTMTQGFYLQWNSDHIHLGLFEPGECPRPDEMLLDSAVLRAEARIVMSIPKLLLRVMRFRWQASKAYVTIACRSVAGKTI